MAKDAPGKGSGKSAGSGGKAGTRPAARPTGGSSRPAGAAAAKSAPGSRSSRARKPPPVVSKQPKPWGWIAIAVVVAVFAAGAIGYAIYTVNESAPPVPGDITGLQTVRYDGGVHVTGNVTYAETPPVGGEHDNAWLDCNGQVYDIQVRNENAVHGLEHGAVWITYRPDLPQDQIDALADLVDGEGYTFMSPYPDQESPISLQAWGNQLVVDSADDARIELFIDVFRQSSTNTPEPGASCDRPEFLADPLEEGGPADASPAPSSAPPTDAATPTAP